MPIFGQKCQFWAKFGRFLAKKTIFWGDGVKLLVLLYDHLVVQNNIQPSLGNFEPNLAVFGPKILIFMGVSKSFGTNITENHQDNLSALFFGQALDQMGQKCRYLAKNARLGQIWQGVKILV